MLAEQFIDRLEQQGLLDKGVVDKLRKKIEKAQKKRKVTPEAIAKVLVESGHLTKFQATKLVADFTAMKGSGREQRPALNEAQAPTREIGGEEELGLAASDSRMDVAVEDAPGNGANNGNEPAAAVAPQPTQPVAPPQEPPPPAPTGGLEELFDDAMVEDLGGDLEQGNALMPNEPQKGGMLGGLFGGGGEQSEQHAVAKIEPTSEWDSKLLLIGGGALGVLVVLGFFLFFALTRGNEEEMFQDAEEAYRSGSYSQAIKKYEKFGDKFPRSANASLASVKIGAAKLRLVYKSPREGLKSAQSVLPGIEEEEAFAEIRGELATMLPQIASGFATQGVATDNMQEKAALLKQIDAAMKLVNNPSYIPTSLRGPQEGVIVQIQEDRQRINRDINRDTELRNTIAEMETSLQSGQTRPAYAAYDRLLQTYPGLDSHPDLLAALRKVTDLQRDKTRVLNEQLASASDDHAAQTDARAVLTDQRGNPVSGVRDHVIYILAGGSVFSLDATTGEVLWSRFVGHETAFHPLPITTRQAGADAVVVDAVRKELLRLNARTGELVWRLPVDADFSAPLVTDAGIFVTTKSDPGLIYRVDPASGKSEIRAELPEELSTGAGADTQRKKIYQTGHHDNLYVLDDQTLECKEVFPIGHRAGTIAVPPAMALGFLFVAVNSGRESSVLHILATDEEGLNLKNAQRSIPLKGQVVVPMLVSRRRILIVTDLGGIHLFDIDPNEKATPATPAADLRASGRESITSYPLEHRGYMWMADTRLTKYQVQTTTGNLPREWVVDEGDVYVAPLQLYGDVLFHTRRRKGLSGVTVSAMKINEQDPQWQTDLALQTSQLMLDQNSSTIRAITNRAQLFQLDEQDLTNGHVEQALESSSAEHPGTVFTESIDMGDGRRVLAGARHYDSLLLYDPSKKPALRSVKLSIASKSATAEPTLFSGGLIVPQDSGLVALINPETGAEQMLPFHPPIITGTSTTWNRPAVLENNEFVIANNHQQMFRIGVRDEPRQHLAQLAIKEVEGKLVGPLSASGSTVFGVLRSAAADEIVSFASEDLAIGEKWPLKGRVIWGPRRIGDDIFVATDSEFICLDGEPSQRWVAPLEHGALAGAPMKDGDHLIVATRSGKLQRFSAETGELIAETEVGEPLDSGPISFAQQLLLAGYDGALLLVQPVNAQ